MEKLNLAYLIKNIWQLILIVGSLTILGAYGGKQYTELYIPNVYKSSVTIMAPLKKDGNVSNDIATNILMINTYKDIVKGSVLLDQVSSNLQNERIYYSSSELSGKISMHHSESSQVFELEIVSNDPYEAQIIAKKTFEQFQKEAEKLVNVSDLEVVSSPKVIKTPIYPHPYKNLLIGGSIGFLSGIGVLVLLDFNRRNKEIKEDVILKAGITQLGKVPQVSLRKKYYLGKKLKEILNSKQSIQKG